jgi:hypothetical protein
VTLRDCAQPDGAVPGATPPVRDVGDDLIDGRTGGRAVESGDRRVQKIGRSVEVLRGESQCVRVY